MCMNPPAINLSQYEILNWNSSGYNLNDTLLIRCRDGKKFQGLNITQPSVEATCNSAYIWDYDLPPCVESKEQLNSVRALIIHVMFCSHLQLPTAPCHLFYPGVSIRQCSKQAFLLAPLVQEGYPLRNPCQEMITVKTQLQSVGFLTT